MEAKFTFKNYLMNFFVCRTLRGQMEKSIVSAEVEWNYNEPLRSGRQYTLTQGKSCLIIEVVRIKKDVRSEQGERALLGKITKGQKAVVEVVLVSKVDAESLGADKYFFTSAEDILGTLSFCYTLRRSSNVVWQETDISRSYRANQKGQLPMTIWFTGLSGSGKSTLANALEKRLAIEGYHTMLLDGDNVRHGLNKNLGFTEADRIENIRRVAEVGKLMNEAGLITLGAFISPYRSEREMARQIIGEHFIEVYVATSLETCEKRDAKGLYSRARAGNIPNFTGISAPYEKPENPEFVVDTNTESLETVVERLFTHIMWKKT